MNNFSDLLVTETHTTLDIQILSKQGPMRLVWPILINLDIACLDPISVCVDGMEVINFGYQHDGLWRITLHEPFYRWRHRVTGQGWLLEPASPPKSP